MRAVHGKHRVMERRGEKASLQKKKNPKQNEKTYFFFGLHFQYVGMSLKLTALPSQKKMESSLIRKKEKEKKKNQKCPRLLAHLSAWQIGEVTVAVFGIFEIRHKKKEKKKENGVEADTLMTLCRKALWRLTSGGLSTSSEVERLVPSSHTTAEEEETGLIYVWIHVNTMLLGPFYLHPMFSPRNPREIVKSISRKTWLREHLQNKHKNCVSKQQSIDKYKEKGKSPNLQITWHLNVKYKSVLFTDTLKTIQYLPKLQITMT